MHPCKLRGYRDHIYGATSGPRLVVLTGMHSIVIVGSFLAGLLEVVAGSTVERLR